MEFSIGEDRQAKASFRQHWTVATTPAPKPIEDTKSEIETKETKEGARKTSTRFVILCRYLGFVNALINACHVNGKRAFFCI